MVRSFRSTSLILAAALVAVPATAFAGPDKTTPQILVGITFSQLRWEDTSNFTTESRSSLTAGMSFLVPVLPDNSPVSMRAHVMVVPRGGTVDDGFIKEKIRLTHIDVTALFDWETTLKIQGDGIHVLFGPTMGILTSASAVANQQVVGIRDSVHPIEFGLTVGVQVPVIADKFDVQVLYNAGLRGVFKTTVNQATNSTLLLLVSPTILR